MCNAKLSPYAIQQSMIPAIPTAASRVVSLIVSFSTSYKTRKRGASASY
jgi:hypothetical protein